MAQKKIVWTETAARQRRSILEYWLNQNKSNPYPRIKAVLKEKGIKQTWLAEKLGKSYNMVNSHVQNRSQPSIEDVNMIANILDVDVKDSLESNKKRI